MKKETIWLMKMFRLLSILGIVTIGLLLFVWNMFVTSIQLFLFIGILIISLYGIDYEKPLT